MSATDTSPPSGTIDEISALRALTGTSYAFVLTNPQLDDNPIVYVNRAFEEMTGYTSEMAVGRNCRFLQGDDQDQPAVGKLRAAIKDRKQCKVLLRNYRADGSQFYNRLMFTPLSDGDDGNPYLLGVQVLVEDKDTEREDVADALAEIQHRVKNHLSMIVGMIRLQARKARSNAGQEFDMLARRVETLQLLYEEMNAGEGRNATDRVNLGAYLTRVANSIAYLDGRSGVRVNIDADQVSVPMEAATQLGLILSEVMTNAMQHAFDGRDSGLVEVRIKQLSDGVLRIQVADDGIGIPEDVTWPDSGSLGGRIVAQLVKGLNAELSVNRALSGTTISFDIPSAQTETTNG